MNQLPDFPAPRAVSRWDCSIGGLTRRALSRPGESLTQMAKRLSGVRQGFTIAPRPGNLIVLAI